MQTSWIKINDWRNVSFPTSCSFSGLKTDDVKAYYVENTSVLWIVLRILQIGQYITVSVPFSSEGLKEMKKQRRKKAWIGLAIGACFALAGLVLGVWISVEAETKHMKDMGIMIGGITFLFSLILGPILAVYRWHLKNGPLYFRKKDKQLWVKIRNDAYRSAFKELNSDCILEDDSSQDILDQH